MNENKNKNRMSEYQDEIACLEGDKAATSRVRKRRLKEGLFILPIYIAFLAILSLILFAIGNNDNTLHGYFSHFKICMAIFLLPVLIGWGFQFIFPIFDFDADIFIGIAAIFIYFVSNKLFHSKEASIVISFLVLVVFLQWYAKISKQDKIDKIKQKISLLQYDL